MQKDGSLKREKEPKSSSSFKVKKDKDVNPEA